MKRVGVAAVVAVVCLGAYLAIKSDGSGNNDANPDRAAITTTTTTTATTTSTTTTTTTTVPEPRTARLAFTGDLLPHSPVVRAAGRLASMAGTDGWDFRSMFDEVRHVLTGADLAICHLESPISYHDTNLAGYPLFNAPRALVEAVADAGYDGCSTASNHSFDRGASGVVATLDALDEMNMAHAGMARSSAEDLSPRLYDVNGISVAHISATYGLNGFSMPADRTYLVDLIEPDEIVAEAALARSAGAEFVVLSLHWGNEYVHQPSSTQQRWLNEILASPDVDLVVGHHAHVVQPIDRLDDRWVVFGLGNFLSNQSANCCVTASQDGMIAVVSIGESLETGRISTTGVHYIPTWVDRRNGYVIRIAKPGRLDVPAPTAQILAKSELRTVEVVGSRLGPSDGLTSELDVRNAVVSMTTN